MTAHATHTFYWFGGERVCSRCGTTDFYPIAARRCGAHAAYQPDAKRKATEREVRQALRLSRLREASDGTQYRTSLSVGEYAREIGASHDALRQQMSRLARSEKRADS